MPQEEGLGIAMFDQLVQSALVALSECIVGYSARILHQG